MMDTGVDWVELSRHNSIDTTVYYINRKQSKRKAN